MHMGSDGRIWNEYVQRWAEENEYNDVMKASDYSSGSKTPVDLHRARLIYEAFTGRPIEAGMMIEHKDENTKNCQFTNLRPINPRPIADLTRPTKQFQLVQRPDPRPPSQPTLAQPSPENRVEPPPGAAPGVEYARYPLEPFTNYLIGTDGSVYNSANVRS